MADQTVSLQLDGDASGLKAELQESADNMDQLAGASTQAGDDIEAAVTGATSAWEEHSGVINGAAAALGGAGAAIEGLARSQQDMRATAGRLSNTIEGETTDSIMGLAAEVHDATRDLDEMVAMMETGSQQGLESGQDLQDYAVFWDTVGDATGEAAGSLAESSAALRAVGIAAGDEKDALGAFGFIAQETTGSVNEFLQFIDRVGPELRDMNADVDDAAAVLGIMEHELGMSGRTARQEFRTAINESDGSLEGLLDTLGIGQGVFADYRGEVEASSGVIEDNAQAFKDSRTFAQELQADLEALGARFSGVLDAADGLASGMMAVGGVMFAVNQGRAAMQAMNITGGKLIGVLGRSAGVAGAAVAATWAISEFGEAVSTALHGAAADAADLELALEGVAQNGAVPDAVLGTFDTLADSLAQIADPGWAEAGQAHVPEWLKDPNWKRSRDEVKAFDQTLAQLATSGNTEALGEGLDMLEDMANDLGIPLEELIQTHFPQYARAADKAALASDDEADATEGSASAHEEQADAIDAAKEAHDEYTDALRAATDPVFALNQALKGVDDATQAYNDVLEDNEASQEDVERAALDLAQAVSGAEQAAINGDLSFDDFSSQLDDWVASGAITADQADNIRSRVSDLRGEAENYQGNYNAHMLAETGSAQRNIDALERKLARLTDTPYTVTIDQQMGRRVSVSGMGGGFTERAAGGPVDPSMGAVLVGEQGPELVTFGQRGMVHDAQSTAAALAPAPTVVNHIYPVVELDGYRVGQSPTVNQGIDMYARDRSRDTAA